jgi:hypothetical protein
MTDPAGIPALQDAIRHLHGVESEHVETAHVREMHKGALVWEGDIEVFQLARHPKATKAYAWSEATTGNKRRFFVVLHAVGVDTPLMALRASLLVDAQADKKRN